MITRRNLIKAIPAFIVAPALLTLPVQAEKAEPLYEHQYKDNETRLDAFRWGIIDSTTVNLDKSTDVHIAIENMAKIRDADSYLLKAYFIDVPTNSFTHAYYESVDIYNGENAVIDTLRFRSNLVKTVFSPDVRSRCFKRSGSASILTNRPDLLG